MIIITIIIYRFRMSLLRIIWEIYNGWQTDASVNVSFVWDFLFFALFVLYFEIKIHIII